MEAQIEYLEVWSCPCPKCGQQFQSSQPMRDGQSMFCGQCQQCVMLSGEDIIAPPPKPGSPLADILEFAARTARERAKLWGNNYKEAGAVMAALLPAGVELKTSEQWNRFLVFCHIINKLTRYAQNINRGGNKDSAHDMMVYSAMLEELTQEQHA